jgi:AcrR family transcriptional regulator
MSTSSRSGARRPPSTGDGYHHGNLRSALVEAAIALIEESDSADFSLREAARRVGVTVNASYRHFASKEDLMTAVAAEGFRRFSLALLKGSEQPGNAAERLMGSGRAYVRFACDHPALFRLMFSKFSAGRQSAELSETARLAYHTLRAGMATTLGRETDDPVVSIAAVRAWSLAHGLSYLILDGQLAAQPLTESELVEAILGQAPEAF